MKTVFFDVDTQLDFVYPAGALYVPGAERVVPVAERLNQYAAAHSIPVISTTDAHLEKDAEFREWPPHCVAGTHGQRKPESTRLKEQVVVPLQPGAYAVAGAQQIIVEKRSLDCFTNPNLSSVLDQLGAEKYVVYGVVTEYCVFHAAMGLLKADRRVEVVADAIQTLRKEDGDRAIQEFTRSGGVLIQSSEIVGAA